METCATVEEILGKMKEQADAQKEKNEYASLTSPTMVVFGAVRSLKGRMVVTVPSTTTMPSGSSGCSRRLVFCTTSFGHNIINQNKMTRAVIKTLNDHIRTISRMLVDHGKILQALVHVVGPLVNLKMEAVEDNSPMVPCRKTLSTAADPQQPNVCKLTFEDQDSVSSQGSDIRQTKHGLPFTYHTHPAFHVASEMPQVMTLLFGCDNISFLCEVHLC
ncbi:hypothetical protein AHAS_Ahas11G0095400 [Arachis hypogaea]